MAEQKSEQSSKILNVKPVDYKQTDARWKNVDYSVPGESTTIGRSGCGPTSAAMVIATVLDKNETPVEACKWSVDHGYKALKQGTYYGFFTKYFQAHGIFCEQMLKSRILNQPNHPIHDEVKKLLNEGWYVIALMGPGRWTSGGHYILCYGWRDGTIYIADPASSKQERLFGDEKIFKKEVRCYWKIDVTEFNRKHGKIIEEDEDMTIETFSKLMDEYNELKAKEKASKWAEQDIKEALEEGILAKNDRMHVGSTREESLAFTMRAYRKLKKMIEKKK